MQLPELKHDFSNAGRGPIQDTTLAKDVIARYTCNTLDEVKAAGLEGLTAIVIGSGMYGAFCAERMFRRGGKVLVLEAGPFVISEHIQNMSDPDFSVVETAGLVGLPAFGEYTSPVKPSSGTPQRIDYAAHSYNAGGKSIRWGGWSPRLTEGDLVQWPAEMAQYFRNHYREIEFQIGAFPTADFIQGALAEVLFTRAKALEQTLGITQVLGAPIAAQAEQPASGLFSFDKYSSLPVLVETLRDDAKRAFDNAQSVEDATSRRGLVLVPRCRVLRLESVPSEGGRRVTALRVLHGHQPPVIDLLPVPPGCAVVLAANSLESTRLALESFVDPSSAATTQIGRNLQIHLRTDIMVRVPRAGFEAELRQAATRIVNAEQAGRSNLDPVDPRPVAEQVEAMLRTLQTAAFHIQCSNGQRRFHLQLIALTSPGGAGDELLYRQDTSLPELASALAGQQSSFIALKFILVGEILSSDKPVGATDAPWANLSEHERDAFAGQGNPQVIAQDYSARKLYTFIPLSQVDEDFWILMDRTALAVTQALAGAAGGVQYFYKQSPENNQEERAWHDVPPGDAQLRDLHHSLGSTYHEAGTMRMGAGPGNGVVDTAGKLFGVDNVYACDQAVFVTSGSANPVPTGLVVAQRVAEAIAPDVVVTEPGFKDLFVFAQPSATAVTIPLELGAMPVGWRFLGRGRFVRRGSMVETDGGLGILYYAAQEFQDFVLKVQWRCPLLRGNRQMFNNSGIYVRWPALIRVAPGVDKPVQGLSPTEFDRFAIKAGYEIQIDDTGYRPPPDVSGLPEEFGNPFHSTGAIYPAHFTSANPFSPRPQFQTPQGHSTGHPAASLQSNAPGQWNEYVIRVQGFTIRVELNGHVVNEAQDVAKTYPRGAIGLQNHFNGYRVQFRNVRIREL